MFGEFPDPGGQTRGQVERRGLLVALPQRAEHPPQPGEGLPFVGSDCIGTNRPRGSSTGKQQ
ncbi:hypothetical protein [Streptomyces collinus]|uniref:hypothetical protein n=1 Tax=Streptomyces collinus TaxID=42684 RepID=UPI0029422A64|nr:hypothetical protein [Streptomyces collinus]